MSDQSDALALDGGQLPEAGSAVREGMQIVLFKLADVYYGVDVGQVQGVVDVQTITKVPNAPYYVEGITNLRGEVITVLDLRKKFGVAERGEGEDFKLVVVGRGTGAVGVTVDAVNVVMDLAGEVIDDMPDLVTDVSEDCFLGVARQEDYMIVLVDLLKVVSSIDTSFLDTAALDATADAQMVPAG